MLQTVNVVIAVGVAENRLVREDARFIVSLCLSQWKLGSSRRLVAIPGDRYHSLPT